MDEKTRGGIQNSRLELLLDPSSVEEEEVEMGATLMRKSFTVLGAGTAGSIVFRRAALLEKTEPGLLCCPSSELTIHGRALAEKCSTGELHGTALIVRHRLYRRLIRSRASPPVPRLELVIAASVLQCYLCGWIP